MIQIVILTIVSSIIIVYLKSVNSELYLLALIGAGIILLGYSIKYIVLALDFINNLVELSGVDKELYIVIFKVTAIGYIVEFGAGTVQDFGLKSLADKLVFVGKLAILSVSFPVIYAVYNLLSGLIS